MTYHAPSRLRTALAAGALGVTMVVGLGACSSGGGDSTAKVCSDLDTKAQTLKTQMATAFGSLDPSSNPDQLAGAVVAVKTVFGSLSTLLRDESKAAKDSGLSKALSSDADQLDATVKKINSPTDLATLDSSSLDFSNIDTYCPNSGFNE